MSCIIDIANKKSVLVASDIFGISDALLTLVEDANISEQAMLVSPYKLTHHRFKNEAHAYQCFVNEGGIEAYIVRLTKVVSTHPEIKYVIGFSAGGAAMYRVMSHLSAINIRLTLFYPRQIRYYLDKQPCCPCHIIFPESEKHFALPKVITALRPHSALTLEQNTYQHGFMNKDSTGFNQSAYEHYCQMLKRHVHS